MRTVSCPRCGPKVGQGKPASREAELSTWLDEPGVVLLPDGRKVRGARAKRPRGRVPAPDFAVYLLSRDPQISDWPARWVRWPDFRLPRDPGDALDALREAHARAPTERVEIACGGGIGRTGTAIAILATMSGLPAAEAFAWARAHYHRRAVETRRQRAWVASAPCFKGGR